MISRRPEIRGGRPCIAGTGISVKRVAIYSNMGYVPEEISHNYGHVSLAQVHAALAYYHANREEIDADIAAELREAEALEKEFPRAEGFCKDGDCH